MNVHEAEKHINELLALEVADSYPDYSRLDPETQAFQVGYLRRQLAELCAAWPHVRESLEETLLYVQDRESRKGVAA